MSVPGLVLSGLGCICILYGIMVMMVGSGTVFFAVWILLGCAGILISRLLKTHFFESLPKAVNLLFIVLLVAGILVLCVCEIFILTGFHKRPPEEAEYLIVLGAQVRENGPSKALSCRLDSTSEYMRNHENVLCIVSGGQGYNEPASEGSAMKKYLMEAGIDEGRIIAEEKAVNTVENIRFSKEFLPSSETKVVIVTNNFHVARAMAIARKQGLTHVYGLAAPSDPLFLPNNMLREACSVLKERVMGNI